MILKDLQILRRSKLLVGLLIVYPVAIALLIGFALSSGPDKPSLAFLNKIPPSQQTIRLGSQKIDINTYTNKLFGSVKRVDVENREQAVEQVRSGKVLAALIIPPNFATLLSTGGLNAASVEVIYNGDALKQSFVRSTVESKLAEADAALARQITRVAGGYIDSIAEGGRIDVAGLHFKLIGLRKTNE
ncbi:MAG TPA: hypothetical protein VL120_18475, partial [Solirubrobacteraceae bacterium]|nr:hypothetical protein [Solirubrobacteraceae bacterium]